MARKPALPTRCAWDDGQGGLTIVELMVSVLLATMLSAGLFYMTSGQSKTYQAQYANLTTQENLWGAMEYLQRQLRLAGYGFGGCNPPIATKGGAPPLAPITVYNDCNLFTTNPTACPPTVSATPANPDSLTVAFADPTQDAFATLAALRTDAAVGPGGPVCFATMPNFQACDLVVLWDPLSANCALAMVSTAPAPASAGLCTGKIEMGIGTGGSCPGVGTYNASTLPSAPFPAGALAVRLGSNAIPRHFAIDQATDPPRLVTWPTRAADPKSDTSDLEVVADGIEDLQIAIGCDNDESGDFLESPDPPAAPNKTTDEWRANVASDTSACAAGIKIGIVRITLVARSAGIDNENATGRRPAAEDHAAAAAADRYRRAVLTTTVRPRNLR